MICAEYFVRQDLGAAAGFYENSGEWNQAIKEMKNAARKPVKVARRLNELIAGRFDNHTYSATPERVNGLTRVLRSSDFNSTDCRNKSQNLNNSKIDAFFVFQSGFYGITFSSVADGTKALFPYFIYGNQKGKSDDAGFGESVADYLKLSYPKLRMTLDLGCLSEYDSWIEGILKNIAEVNWEKQFSSESLNRNITDDCYRILWTNIPTSDIYQQIFNRGLSEDREYQRLLLARWLRQMNPGTLEEALEKLKRSIVYFNRKAGEFSGEAFLPDTLRQVNRFNIFLKKVLEDQRDFAMKMIEN